MTRLLSQVRRDQILAAALDLAERHGYQNVTRDAIAVQIKCAPGLISYHFSTMPQLKRAVMRAAIAKGVVTIVAQGLVDKNPYACRAPESLRKQALRSIGI